MTTRKLLKSIGAALVAAQITYSAAASAEAARLDELAKDLANPIANLISVPMQLNYDRNIGAEDDGYRITTNIQPVVPISLNEDWNLISRTILPVTHQNDITATSGSQTGLGDVVQSLFFSPVSDGSLTWGIGPVFLLPTTTDEMLGTEKWGAGPTAVVLKQKNGWTLGGLANHIESFAGEDDRADISSTFLNPFIAKGIGNGWTLGGQLEHTLDHKNDQDTGVMTLYASKVTSIGDQMVSFTVGPRYWYEDTDSSPEGFGLRAVMVFLFPK